MQNVSVTFNAVVLQFGLAYMKALWLSFQADKKPEWLSFEGIEAYEKRMSEDIRYDD